MEYVLKVVDTDKWENLYIQCPIKSCGKVFRKKSLRVHFSKTQKNHKTIWKWYEKHLMETPLKNWPWQHKTVDKSSFPEKLR